MTMQQSAGELQHEQQLPDSLYGDNQAEGYLQDKQPVGRNVHKH